MMFDPSRYMQKTLKDVHERYGFLFAKGYEVFSADVVDLGWQVVLRKQDLFIKILNVREEEDVHFRIGSPPPDEYIDMGSVLYAATGEMIPPWKIDAPKVLAQNLESIETYLSGEYVNNKDSLRTAQEKYYAENNALLRAEQEAYYAANPQVELASPAEPKPKSILYYPLLGIIILLILGGLVTLCLVLAESLFGVF